MLNVYREGRSTCHIIKHYCFSETFSSFLRKLMFKCDPFLLRLELLKQY
jgi:hypothetical protein